MASVGKAQITISGQLQDSTNTPVSTATVMLLNPKDSTLLNYTSSNAQGIFSFKNVKNNNYILQVSHITYMPYRVKINPTEEKTINLGMITLAPIANFLMEVVIKEARAPIFIKGDTVEYDASTFKVPPGSTVEDLLKKLPGIEVDANGKIQTMGKDVSTVYVDGKTFFGNDPKTVTKNLDAEAISKVQVYEEKSEQEKITGIADGSEEKVMNLELKNEYKKGYFGKITAGYGYGKDAPHRWMGNGNFNWFNDKQQLSFIGYGNNINVSNLDWNEYMDFYGQSMNSGHDDGNFGFESGNHYGNYIYFSNYSYGGSGFSQNAGGGVNYNYYNKKIKYNVGYFYTLNKTLSDQFANRQTFLQDSTFWRFDTLNNNNTRQNHSFSTRLEYEIDTMNSLIFKANVDYSLMGNRHAGNQLFQNNEFVNINQNHIDNTKDDGNLNLKLLAIYKHKFQKKRRSFAMSAAYDFSDGKGIENIKNINDFYDAVSLSDQIKFIVQNNNNSEDHTLKSSLLYVEPLSKRFSLLGFYNFRINANFNKNFSTDPGNHHQEIDSLWVNYKNTMLYNRAGVSLNYMYNGITITLGGAFQSLILDALSELRTSASEKNSFSYNNFIPYFSANFTLPKNVRLNFSYKFDVKEPSINYLFPMPDLSNTFYKTNGNPLLTPERNHAISGRLSYWNNASMFNVSLSANASFYQSQIVYNQLIEYVNNLGYVTSYTPANVAGGNRVGAYFWTNFPIVKTILTMNLSADANFNNSPVFINSVKNISYAKNWGAHGGFHISVKEILSFYINGGISQNFTNYSIQVDRNQKYMNYNASVSVDWKIYKKTYFEVDYRFTNYNNKELAFNQDIHTLNASIRQVLGKKNRFELRLAAIDILNQSKEIAQVAGINYIQYSKNPTLARYFLLTFSYNMKGFNTDNKNSFF
jgi:hypothetical protein